MRLQGKRKGKSSDCQDEIAVMRFSIIGAGRNKNGIDEYIGKYFCRSGAEVASVLRRTEETSQRTSLNLEKNEIKSNPYTDFHEMVEKEKPDSFVITSPSSTHHDYLVKCIGLRLNIFCEKPFVTTDLDDMKGKVEDIPQKAQEKRLTVAMNSQWPFTLRYCEKICGEIEIRKSNRLFITLSPVTSGSEMISEAVPHALSLLYSASGGGEIGKLIFESPIRHS